MFFHIKYKAFCRFLHMYHAVAALSFILSKIPNQCLISSTSLTSATLLSVYPFTPRRFFTLSHSLMAAGYRNDSTLCSDVYPRAQHVRCSCCSLLCWGFRTYFIHSAEHALVLH